MPELAETVHLGANLEKIRVELRAIDAFEAAQRFALEESDKLNVITGRLVQKLQPARTDRRFTRRRRRHFVNAVHRIGCPHHAGS